MTTIEFKHELARLHESAEAADKRLADFVVTLWSWIVIFGITLLCVEVML